MLFHDYLGLESDKHAKLTLTQFKKFTDLPDVFIHTQLIIALPFPSNP